MSTRFDSVIFDEVARETQARFKRYFVDLEERVEYGLVNGRAKALVMTKLEEAHMWVGKAIRDDQVWRATAMLRADDLMDV